MKRYWWQETNIYQIYPRSFQDSNGDGIGDLPGILKRLDYLKTLGVETIWLSPINLSPMADNGYDIADYYTVDPIFGTNADLELLLEETGKRGMRVLLDLVVNHCSDRHEWFRRALADPAGPYRDYFFFRKGVDGRPPNNWRSAFGGSAWEQVPGSDDYYLHVFARQQPDLNWDNPSLREEIYAMMNHWLDKGAAGFRLDAITYLKKEDGLPSYPADGPDGLVSVTHGSRMRPGIEGYLREMRDRTFGRSRLTVGEAGGIPKEEQKKFIGLEDGCFSMTFDFSICTLDFREPTCFWCEPKAWTPEDLKEKLFRAQLDAQPECWMANVLECHDSPRAVSYYLPEEGRNFHGASMLAVLSLCRRGTPVLYQGQEFGMANQPFRSIADYNDISSHGQYRIALERGCSEEEALHFVQLRSRDNARYPVSWDSSEKAGFTTGTPWLPLAPERTEINAEDAVRNPESLYWFYRNLLKLRRSDACGEQICYGIFRPYLPEQRDLIAYFRCLERPEEKGALLVLCSYRNGTQAVPLPEGNFRVLLDNYGVAEAAGPVIELQPYEAMILQREERPAR